MENEFVSKLRSMLPTWFQSKKQNDDLTKIVNEGKDEIKSLMLSAGVDKFEVDGITASRTVSVKESFDEELLLQICKDYLAAGNRVPGLIKKKEYVDMDALENAIYNRKFPPELLVSAQIKTETVTLRVTAKKGRE